MIPSGTLPSPASAITYHWDNNGDLTGTGRGSDTFAYDNLYRPTSVTYPGLARL